jgi:hypothetical protein
MDKSWCRIRIWIGIKMEDGSGSASKWKVGSGSGSTPPVSVNSSEFTTLFAGDPVRPLALAAPRTHSQHSHRTEHEANFRRVTGV